MNGTAQGTQLEVARIQSEINRLFEMLLRLKDDTAHGQGFSPLVDVAEAEPVERILNGDADVRQFLRLDRERQIDAVTGLDLHDVVDDQI